MRALAALLAILMFSPTVGLAQAPSRRTFVIVHGAWGGGWDWKTVDSMLTRRGHRVVRVTLTGLGERTHLVSASVGLDTHVMDVVNTVLWENLHDIILVGHSYGGMVITGAADRIPKRIRRLVYVDALLPDSGESARSLLNDIGFAWVDSTVQRGLSVPTWVTDTTAIPRAVPHPYKTLTDTLRLTSAAQRSVPGTYILTFEPNALPDAFQPFANRAKARGWPVQRLQGSHAPEQDAPGPLVALLLAVP